MEPGAPVPSPALLLTRQETRGQVTETLFCASISAPEKHRWTPHLLDRGAGREASGLHSCEALSRACSVGEPSVSLCGHCHGHY